MLNNKSEEHHQTLDQSQVNQSRLRAVIGLLVILVTVIVIFHVLTLTRFPPAFVDEAWMASRAWGWLQTGLNFGPLDAGVQDSLDGYWTFFPIIPTLIHATAIELFGLSLTSLRIMSLLSGLVLALAVFMIAFLSTQSRLTGFVAVVLLLTSFGFSWSSHLVRPDIFVAALCFSAIALYFFARNTGYTVLYGVGGLLLGLSFEIHVNTVVFVPVFLGLFLVDSGLRFFKRRSFWAFMAGIGVGLAIYLALHVVRYPATYFAMGSRLGQTHAPPLLSGSMRSLGYAFLEMGLFLIWYSAGRVIAAVVAVLAIVGSRNTKDMRPVVMLITAWLSFAILVNAKLDYYMVLVWPFADIVIAMWTVDLINRKEPLGFWKKRGKALGLASLGFSFIFLITIAGLTAPPGDVEEVANRIRIQLNANDTVMGSQTYWFDLTDYPYLSWQQVLNYQNLHPGSTVGEALQDLSPDILVLDQHMRLFILPEKNPPPEFAFQRYAWQRRLPESDVNDFLACRGSLVDSVPTRAYGLVDIYAIDWESGACSSN